MWEQLWARKPLNALAHAAGESPLRRVLGPAGLMGLGLGAILGARLFVTVGRVAALEAGPAVLLSLLAAAAGCALAALSYAELAPLAPVAGGAYSYAYAALG